MKYQNRVVNLFGTSNSEGKSKFAMHLILDHIIKQNANTSTILDFEGSDLKGVNEFYQSFGPERVVYPEYFSEGAGVKFVFAANCMAAGTSKTPGTSRRS